MLCQQILDCQHKLTVTSFS